MPHGVPRQSTRVRAHPHPTSLPLLTCVVFCFSCGSSASGPWSFSTSFSPLASSGSSGLSCSLCLCIKSLIASAQTWLQFLAKMNCACGIKPNGEDVLAQDTFSAKTHSDLCTDLYPGIMYRPVYPGIMLEPSLSCPSLGDSLLLEITGDLGDTMGGRSVR